ncbi:cyanophycin synthetase [soil metagenome]
MKILNIKSTKGVNFWSLSYRNLIVMLLDLEELEYLPTNKIEGFADRLEKMFPSLYQHFCSENQEGGFFIRVREGTWMGHVIEHIALEIQTIAGLDCGFGRTRSAKKEGVYNVVFNYKIEKAGLYAAKAAVAIAESLVNNTPYNLEKDVNALREIKNQFSFGPSTESILQEAIKRGIPYSRIDDRSGLRLGYGKNQKMIKATITSQTSGIAIDIACDKQKTKLLLEKSGIPVPKGEIINNLQELNLAVEKIGYPLVTKPNNGNQGKGAVINIRNWEQAKKAFEVASAFSPQIVVESFITGDDYRFLVINYKLVAVAKRTPAMVYGNGISTIKELIEEINKDPRRGKGHENVLTKIVIDAALEEKLKNYKLNLDSIPEAGKKVLLRETANLSTGGTAENVTHLVHPYNIKMAERIARIIGLDICGIDVLANNIDLPLNDIGGHIIEVNAAPGFRMHLEPTEGNSINVAAPVLDMLFPPDSKSRIPIIAVTGTNGKTTTTRLLAHLARVAGHKVGFTTTEGVYINNELILEGDCTGPKSTEMVIFDPTIDFAVLECARGGILKSGLSFDYCDIGIVTNVTSDHLGLGDVHTLEDMARVKSVVPESVHSQGYAILNADDDLTFKMAANLKCKVALFSLNPENPRIIKHCGNGGFAAYLEHDAIYLRKGKSKRRILNVKEIPLTYGGKATFMIENILPAVIAAYIKNFHIDDIREGLRNFIPSPEFTPGRMNLYSFPNCELLIDYVHNPAGFKAIAKFLNNIQAYPKIGVIAGVGDRRDEDISEIGYLAGEIFDEVIIRNDKSLRGRKAEEINNLLLSGISISKPGLQVPIIPTEEEAIKYVLKTAKPGSFIVFSSETVKNISLLIKKLKEEEIKSTVNLLMK